MVQAFLLAAVTHYSRGPPFAEGCPLWARKESPYRCHGEAAAVLFRMAQAANFH